MTDDYIQGILGADAVNVLTKYFEFDRIFDLTLYDTNMEALYNELNQLKRESYNNNYRFIFLHFDTEYYLSDSTPGFTLINLQRILTRLDIPNYFCLVISQQDLHTQLEQVRISESTDNVAIDCIVSCLLTWAYFSPDKELSINNSNIDKKYITLNRVRRLHRRALVGLLADKNLIADGLVSYNNSVD